MDCHSFFVWCSFDSQSFGAPCFSLLLCNFVVVSVGYCFCGCSMMTCSYSLHALFPTSSSSPLAVGKEHATRLRNYFLVFLFLFSLPCPLFVHSPCLLRWVCVRARSFADHVSRGQLSRDGVPQSESAPPLHLLSLSLYVLLTLTHILFVSSPARTFSSPWCKRSHA